MKKKQKTICLLDGKVVLLIDIASSTSPSVHLINISKHRTSQPRLYGDFLYRTGTCPPKEDIPPPKGVICHVPYSPFQDTLAFTSL